MYGTPWYKEWAIIAVTIFCVVMIGLVVWAVLDEEPDPCRYYVIVGKTAVPFYHEGTITYGGRKVQCNGKGN